MMAFVWAVERAVLSVGTMAVHSDALSVDH